MAYPTTQNGINTYCYWVIGLIFLADFTPLGPLLSSSSSGSSSGSLSALASIQWLLFVLPTLTSSFLELNHRATEGPDEGVSWGLDPLDPTPEDRGDSTDSTTTDVISRFRDIYRLRVCELGAILGGAGLGAALWSAGAALMLVKLENSEWILGISTPAPEIDPLQASANIWEHFQEVVGSSGIDGAGHRALSPDVILLKGLSPAFAEELLFRGYLLTALGNRLGEVDRAAVCGFLFALIHLDPSAFGPLTLLGIGCSFLASRSNSLLPAVGAHFAYNMMGITAGVILSQ